MRWGVWGTSALLVCSVAAGCGSSDTPSARDACNPLGGPACMMPWPSSAYLVDDPSTATGLRVDIPLEAMPENQDGRIVDPATFNTYDGFPVAGTLVAAFETGVSAEGLPDQHDIAASVAPDAPIVVVNMDTGERLPYFAEVDMNARIPEERALLIRPMDRMDSASRYAVGIRKSVKAADGGELPILPGFAKILAGESLDHPLGARIEAGYEDVFAALEAEGVSRDDLALAWEFSTASDEFLTGDILAMRDQALAFVGPTAENLTYDVAEIENANPVIIRSFLAGSYDVPMFLNDGETDLSVLERDADGTPVLVETARANFAALVPNCVETAQLPVPVVVFGHGMFGNAKDSLDFGFLQQIAQDNCVVVIGGDWLGLTNRQFATVAFAMNNVNLGIGLTEKLSQAVINFIVLQKMIRGPLRMAEPFTVNGTPIFDTNRIWYFGASLGGILGGVYMAYEPDIELGVLGVPGGPWSLLFERSAYWPPLRITMKGAYNLNPWDYQQNIALMGMLFEKVDPVTTARRVLAEPLPGVPPKQLLLYMAMGDFLVANIASDTLARALRVPITGPSARTPFALLVQDTAMPSGMTIYDEGVTPWPPEDNAMEDLDGNSTHGDVSERPAVQRQAFDLFNFREVRHECQLDGVPAPCMCESGACD